MKLTGKDFKTLIYYHERDFDGKCAGAIAFNYYKSKGLAPVAIGIDYGKEQRIAETFTPGDRVIMVDWSAPVSIMKQLQEEASEFVWLDHHGTAIDKIQGVEIKGIQKVGDAGCELTWKYFYAEQKMPDVVRLLGRYDVFDKKAEDWSDILKFQLGFNILGSMLPEDSKWIEFLDNSIHLYSYIAAGDYIQKYNDVINENHCRLSGFEAKFKVSDIEYKVFALNTQAKSSQVFKSLEGTYEIFSAFTFSGKRWTVSLYSTKIDVGKICMKLGGGGHAGAAGFECDNFPFEVE